VAEIFIADPIGWNSIRLFWESARYVPEKSIISSKYRLVMPGDMVWNFIWQRVPEPFTPFSSHRPLNALM